MLLGQLWQLGLEGITCGAVLSVVNSQRLAIPFTVFGCAQILAEAGKANHTLLLLELQLQVGQLSLYRNGNSS